MALRFNKNQHFKIVQFTDLHWENGEAEDQKTAELIRLIISIESPDLVVLTGDILSASSCIDAVESMRQVANIFEACGQRWASTFGNHDDEGNASRAQLAETQMNFSTCLTQVGPSTITGVGNYTLPIKPHFDAGERNDTTPVALLYFLDSGNCAPTDIGGFDWVRHDQIEWYRLQAKSYHTHGDKRIPALAFFHIPLPEYEQVWDFHTCYGAKFEPVCSPRINTGLFAAFYQMGDVMGTFVGHDHVNDYEGELHGIRLCYGRSTGYNAYGRKGFLRGGRVIQLVKDQREFQTWLRLSDGSQVIQEPGNKPLERQLTLDASTSN